MSDQVGASQDVKGLNPPVSLTDFLLARIAEDEAVARAATPGPWGIDGGHQQMGPWPTMGVWSGEPDSCHTECDNEADAAHIARHDPVRVVAEAEAKRRIVTIYNDGQATRLLALPYADHPDYRDEWRP